MILRHFPLAMAIAVAALPAFALQQPAKERLIQGKPLSAWIAMLKSDDVKLRRSAATETVRALTNYSGYQEKEFPDLLPALLEALKDSDKTVQDQALQGVLKFQSPKVPPALLDLLRTSKDKSARAKAAGRLGTLVHAPALPALTDALRDQDDGVRAAAAGALGNFGKKAEDSVPQLVKALRDKSPGVRMGAAGSLLTIDTGAAKDAVAEVFDTLKTEKDESWRARAAMLLGEFATTLPESVPAIATALTTALADPKDSVRTQAAHELGRLGAAAKEAVPALVKNSGASLSAIFALGEIAAKAPEVIPTVVPALVIALSDAKEPVKIQATVALGRLGSASKEAVPGLAKNLTSSSERLREGSITALGAIGPDAKAAAPALGEIVVQSRSLTAVLALQKIDPAAAAALLPKLVKGLDSPVPAVRLQTLTIIAQYGAAAKDSVAPLLKALKDANPDVRDRAAWALLTIDWEGTLTYLRTVAKTIADPAEMGRADAAATLALFRIGEEQPDFEATEEVKAKRKAKRAALSAIFTDVIPDLVKGAKDPSAEIRSAMVKSLYQIDPKAYSKSVLPDLLDDVRDKDRDRRLAAVTVMGAVIELSAGSGWITTFDAPLREALKDDDAGVRVKAAEALGYRVYAPPPELVASLVAALKDKDAAVRQAVGKSLKKVSPDAAKKAGLSP